MTNKLFNFIVNRFKLKFKLKYKDGAIKKVCMLLASSQRRKFSQLVWAGKLNLPIIDNHCDFDLISFSGSREFEEQALSIYSFIFHAGLPVRWIIYSDGSHTDREKECLVKLFPFVIFKLWNENVALNDNPILQSYLKTCHLSKKLNVILGHVYERQTMYADSDIVFYKNAFAYFNSNILKNQFWYLPETNWGALKSATMNEPKDMFSLNSGLLVLNKSFNFDLVFDYLKSLDFNFHYFSEQRSFEYSFKKQNANVLDPRKFIVDTEDQFDFSNSFEACEMAVRHYVNPVRHKMWQKGWKWHFE